MSSSTLEREQMSERESGLTPEEWALRRIEYIFSPNISLAHENSEEETDKTSQTLDNAKEQFSEEVIVPLKKIVSDSKISDDDIANEHNSDENFHESFVERKDQNVSKTNENISYNLQRIVSFLAVNENDTKRHMEGLQEKVQAFTDDIDKIQFIRKILDELISKWMKNNKNFSDTDKSRLITEFKKLRNHLLKEQRRLMLIQPRTEEEFDSSLKWFYNKGYKQSDLDFIQEIRTLDYPKKLQSLGINLKSVERLLDMTEEAIKSRLFEFKGQDTPFGDYPAPLVPIGYHKGDLAAVYPESKNAPFMILQKGTTYTEIEQTIYLKYDPNDEQFFSKANNATDSEEVHFDYREHRLFGLKETLVICYEAEQEKDFYKHLLKDETFSQTNPFLRRSLAKFTEDPDTIERELIHCIQHFYQEEVEGMIPNWYKNEQDKLESIWKKQDLSFPNLDDLLKLEQLLKGKAKS